jgi:hypothetical protein
VRGMAVPMVTESGSSRQVEWWAGAPALIMTTTTASPMDLVVVSADSRHGRIDRLSTSHASPPRPVRRCRGGAFAFTDSIFRSFPSDKRPMPEDTQAQTRRDRVSPRPLESTVVRSFREDV